MLVFVGMACRLVNKGPSVSMQGLLQDKGYYPEGRLYVTKTTDENGNVSY